MANFKRIKRLDLLNLLMEFRKNITNTGVAFGNVVYHTDESGSRTKGGKKQLQKFTRVNVTIGSNYEARINRDLTKQGEEANFTAQSKSGMQYMNDEGVILMDVKTGLKRYLAAIVEHNTKAVTVYFHEGNRITYEKAVELDLFAPSHFVEEKTAGRGNMSEEKNFHVINPSFDKIISLTLNKKKYVIED